MLIRTNATVDITRYADSDDAYSDKSDDALVASGVRLRLTLAEASKDDYIGGNSEMAQYRFVAYPQDIRVADSLWSPTGQEFRVERLLADAPLLVGFAELRPPRPAETHRVYGPAYDETFD